MTLSNCIYSDRYWRAFHTSKAIRLRFLLNRDKVTLLNVRTVTIDSTRPEFVWTFAPFKDFIGLVIMTNRLELPGSCSGKRLFWPGKWEEQISRGSLGWASVHGWCWIIDIKKKKKKAGAEATVTVSRAGLLNTAARGFQHLPRTQRHSPLLCTTTTVDLLIWSLHVYFPAVLRFCHLGWIAS